MILALPLAVLIDAFWPGFGGLFGLILLRVTRAFKPMPMPGGV